MREKKGTECSNLERSINLPLRVTPSLLWFLAADTGEMREMNRDERLYRAVMSRDPETLRRLLDADGSIVEGLRRRSTISDGLMNLIVVDAVPSMIGVMLTRIPTFGSILNSQGQCSLHLASARGRVKVVEAIVDSDVNACSVLDRDGMIPLHLAAIKGRLDVLEVLVRASWITASLLTAKGDPILHLCAKNEQFEALIRLVHLVELSAPVGLINFSTFVMLTDSDDNTIFHLLSAKQQPEVLISSSINSRCYFSDFICKVPHRSLMRLFRDRAVCFSALFV